MIFSFKSRSLMITYIAISLSIIAVLFSGCGNDSSSVNPANMYSADGKVNVYLKADDSASVTYGSGAPQFFVDNEIPLKNLKSVGLFVSKINLVRTDGEKSTVFTMDELQSEPTFYLREDYQNENVLFLSDITVKSGVYAKMEIFVQRVWTVYRATELGAEISWDNKSYNQTIVLNSFAPIEVTAGVATDVTARFDISGRVGVDGNGNGQFYPYAFLANK